MEHPAPDPNLAAWLSVVLPAIVSLVVATITSGVAIYVAKAKLKKEHQLQDSAEVVIHNLLSQREWKLRSFESIQKRLRGFGDDELRCMLVRAGAIAFESKDNDKELWGLLSRNEDILMGKGDRESS